MEIGAVIAAAPKENVVRERPQPGDYIVLLGGRTGRDGIGGATGSSKEHTEESLTSCGAEVQKGNPPTERKIQRCNDFGAGGVAVAIGELADGLIIDLDTIKKKYEGLDGTELAISESQERMAVVIDPKDLEAFQRYADAENLESTHVATVTEEPRLIMKWRGQPIVQMNRSFLDTNGVRQHVSAIISQPDAEHRYLHEIPAPVQALRRNLPAAWLENLKSLNVCSQKGLAERFDSQGAETNTATAMTFGLDPDFMSWSPFHGAVYSVVAAAAKMVALGGRAETIRLTFQEYFESLGKDERAPSGHSTSSRSRLSAVRTPCPARSRTSTSRRRSRPLPSTSCRPTTPFRQSSNTRATRSGSCRARRTRRICLSSRSCAGTSRRLRP